MSEEEQKVDIDITSFNPLSLVFHNLGPYEGRVTVALPEFHLKLLDLSLDGDVGGGPYLGGQAKMVHLTLDVKKKMDIEDMVKYLSSLIPSLKKAHKRAQALLDETLSLD